MSASRVSTYRATVVAVAPAVLLAGFLYHPHIGGPLDPDFLARLAGAVAADPTRWAVAHYVTAIGCALLALAFIAVRGRLLEAGETRWSALGLPFVVFGSFLYGLLPAMEFAPLAAFWTGADIAAVEATQAAIFPWFGPTLLASAILFAVGAFAFARAILASDVLGRRVALLSAGALILAGLCRFVPFSHVQFHVQGIALVVALWPLAAAMRVERVGAPATARRRAAVGEARPTVGA